MHLVHSWAEFIFKKNSQIPFFLNKEECNQNQTSLKNPQTRQLTKEDPLPGLQENILMLLFVACTTLEE